MTETAVYSRSATPASSAVTMTLVFTVTWAVIEIVAGRALHGVNALQTVWFRYTVHLLVVLGIWLPRSTRETRPWKTRRPMLQLTRSLMMLIMPVAYIMGIVRGGSNAMVFGLFWAAPLIVMALAYLLSHERADFRFWLLAALGWIAAWLYYMPAGHPTRGVIVFAFAMAGSFSLYIVMTRWLATEPLRSNLFYTAVVPWVALTLLLRWIWVTPTLTQLAAMVFVGVVGLLSLYALDRATDAAPVSLTAPLLHFETAAAAIVSRLIGHGPSLTRVAESAALVGLTTVVTWLILRRSSSILEL